MLFEYALEPAALADDWRTFKYLIEKFGFDRGRLISEFPRSWLRLVYEATAGKGDLDRTRVAELLKRAKGALVRSSRDYDSNLGGWLDNALVQQASDPFHAIIAKQNTTANDSVLLAEEVDETVALFQSSHSWEVNRTGSALASAMGPFLRHGKQIWFVDPFFDVLKPGYVETLRECLRLANGSENKQANWQIHFREHDKRPPVDIVEKRAPAALNGVIPPGVTISLHGWRERPQGADFHARYLLTERGGLGVEAGFEALGDHQQVDMSLLDLRVCESRREAFGPEGAFDQDGPILVVDSNCNVVRR